MREAFEIDMITTAFDLFQSRVRNLLHHHVISSGQLILQFDYDEWPFTVPRYYVYIRITVACLVFGFDIIWI